MSVVSSNIVLLLLLVILCGWHWLPASYSQVIDDISQGQTIERKKQFFFIIVKINFCNLSTGTCLVDGRNSCCAECSGSNLGYCFCDEECPIHFDCCRDYFQLDTCGGMYNMQP